MKKTLKRLLVMTQVLVAGALFATACTNNTSDTKTAATSAKTNNTDTKTNKDTPNSKNSTNQPKEENKEQTNTTPEMNTSKKEEDKTKETISDPNYCTEHKDDNVNCGKNGFIL